jgi:phospholipid/cholesterol/gamma-HCH transport system permease protein
MQPTVERAGNGLLYKIAGDWTVDTATQCLAVSEMIAPPAGKPAVVQCGGLERIDITSAWLLNRRIDALQNAGMAITLQDFKPEHFRFIEQVGNLYHHHTPQETKRSRLARFPLWAAKWMHSIVTSCTDALIFTGWVWCVMGRTLLHPSRFRFKAFIKQCEVAAVYATPIVALISFLIAVVLAYQGSAQLRRFGAEIFSINLVAISVLREMGVLLTAIMLAGRSGSAFAAEIGTMKLNQEVDALKTTGLDPMEVLVLPRILALTLMMPLLAFLANVMGLLGAGVLTVATTDMNWLLFESRLSEAIRINDFWIGMSKAPVFGFLIGTVGCYHGMKVANSAESVGRETTNAVVRSIFIVMLADAIFSIIFTILDL